MAGNLLSDSPYWSNPGWCILGEVLGNCNILHDILHCKLFCSVVPCYIPYCCSLKKANGWHMRVEIAFLIACDFYWYNTICFEMTYLYDASLSSLKIFSISTALNPHTKIKKNLKILYSYCNLSTLNIDVEKVHASNLFSLFFNKWTCPLTSVN